MFHYRGMAPRTVDDHSKQRRKTMKNTWFLVIRHAEVDKKHPAGEAAPLTKNGAGQAKLLAKYCKKAVGLAILPSEDLPRFTQAAAEMEAVGIRVERVEGISFKNMKGNTPIREIVATYRAAGLALMRKLTDDESVPDKVVIIGSYPLIAGLRHDPVTATEEELNAKPEFCTGLTALINDDGSLNIRCRNYEPFPTSED